MDRRYLRILQLLCTLCLLLPALGQDGPVYVTKADMCSSLQAIKESLDAAPEVEDLRCNLDTRKCLTLDCNYNFFIGVTVSSRIKITLQPCTSTPSVNVKVWVLGSRVSSQTYRESTVTSFTTMGVTTRMSITVTQQIYGVIFGVVLHVGTIPVPLNIIRDTNVYMYCANIRRLKEPYVTPSPSPSPSSSPSPSPSSHSPSPSPSPLPSPSSSSTTSAALSVSSSSSSLSSVEHSTSSVTVSSSQGRSESDVASATPPPPSSTSVLSSTAAVSRTSIMPALETSSTPAIEASSTLATETSSKLATETSSSLPIETSSTLATETSSSLPIETSSTLATETSSTLAIETSNSLPIETSSTLATKTSSIPVLDMTSSQPPYSVVSVSTTSSISSTISSSSSAMRSSSVIAISYSSSFASSSVTIESPSSSISSTAVVSTSSAVSPSSTTPTPSPTVGPTCPNIRVDDLNWPSVGLGEEVNTTCIGGVAKGQCQPPGRWQIDASDCVSKDFTGIDEGLNNLSLTGQDVVKSVKNVLQMMFTVLQSHSVSIRPRDLVLVTEGIGQLRRWSKVYQTQHTPVPTTVSEGFSNVFSSLLDAGRRDHWLAVKDREMGNLYSVVDSVEEFGLVLGKSLKGQGLAEGTVLVKPNIALLSRVASRDGDELQIPTKSDLELIDERNLNLSTAVPTVVITNTVVSGRDTPAVTVAILPTLQTLLPSNLSGVKPEDRPRIVTPVVAIVIEKPSQLADSLADHPIRIEFKVNQDALLGGGTVVLRCAYFSEELEQWMTDGVTTETVQDGLSVVCSATHLTAFSVIAYDGQPEPAVLPVWRIVMLVGCCVAGVLVLLAFVFNFCLCGEMFVVHNFFRFSFLLSLFAALFSTALVTAHLACFVLSVFMVYFYLTSLMWLAGVALSVLVVISKNTTFKKLSKRKWIVFGSLIAWGLPAIVAILTGSVEGLLGSEQSSVSDVCLIRLSRQAHWALFGPMIAITALMLLGVFASFYLLFVMNKSTSEKNTRKQSPHIERRRKTFQRLLVFVLVILVLLDAAILFAALTFYFAQLWAAVLFTVAAILMSLIVFLSYGLCHEEICHKFSGSDDYYFDQSESNTPVSISCRMSDLDQQKRSEAEEKNGLRFHDDTTAHLRWTRNSSFRGSITEEDVTDDPLVTVGHTYENVEQKSSVNSSTHTEEERKRFPSEAQVNMSTSTENTRSSTPDNDQAAQAINSGLKPAESSSTKTASPSPEWKAGSPEKTEGLDAREGSPVTAV